MFEYHATAIPPLPRGMTASKLEAAGQVTDRPALDKRISDLNKYAKRMGFEYDIQHSEVSKKPLKVREAHHNVIHI